MNELTVLAPAKLNISLDITGITNDGYHLMDMIMQTVNVFDKVTIKKQNTLTVKTNNSTLPVNQLNSADKAAVVFFQEVGLMAGADIYIEKTIPVKAGMAGGSADAAAVLVGLNALYNTGFSKEKLADLGKLVGADVPFSIIGGTARVQGIGEKIKKLYNMPTCYFVVCMPSYGIRTPEAFARYDQVGTSIRPNNDAIENALYDGNLKKICLHMGNALQEAAQGKDTDIIVKQLMHYGALQAQMTGSGAAVFGIFENHTTAQIAYNALKTTYTPCFLAEPFLSGAVIKA